MASSSNVAGHCSHKYCVGCMQRYVVCEVRVCTAWDTGGIILGWIVAPLPTDIPSMQCSCFCCSWCLQLLVQLSAAAVAINTPTDTQRCHWYSVTGTLHVVRAMPLALAGHCHRSGLGLSPYHYLQWPNTTQMPSQLVNAPVAGAQGPCVLPQP